MGTPFLVNDELLDNVHSYYPAPLADPYVRLFAELRSLEPRWDSVFRWFIDCFEISVSFMACICTAQYLKHPQMRADTNSTIYQFFQNPKPATGTWWSLLREALRAQQSGEGCPGLLAKQYFRSSGKVSPIGVMLDRIPSVRNTQHSHAWSKEINEYKSLVDEHIVELERWYETLDFFDRYILLQPLQCRQNNETNSYTISANVLSGSRYFFPRRCYDCDTDLHIDKLYLVVDPGAQVLSKNDILCLHPFCLKISNEKSLNGDIFLYTSNGANAINYSSPRNSETASCPELKTELDALMQPLLWVDKQAETAKTRFFETFLGIYADRLRAKSDVYLGFLLSRRIYLPQVFVQRTALQEDMDQFMKSDKYVMIIEGPSGIGKSSFLCNFVQRRLVDHQSTHLTLFVDASSLPETHFRLERIVCEYLGWTQEFHQWVAASVAKADNQVDWSLVVVIDGIDKNSNPGELLRAINTWASSMYAMDGMLAVKSNDSSFDAQSQRKGLDESPKRYQIKLIATCNPGGIKLTTSDVQDLDEICYFAPARAVRSASDCELRLPSVQLLAFTEEERQDAYKLYRLQDGPVTAYEDLSRQTKRIISHPLFTRMISEAYSKQEVPVSPLSMQTLQKYCDGLIFRHRGRKEFVENLIGHMLELRTRRVSGSDICKDEKMREVYLNEDSPFQDLLHNQILTTRRYTVSEFPLAIEEEFIEFSFDLVFQYLLILRVIQMYVMPSDLFDHDNMRKVSSMAQGFTALRSGFIDLLVEVIRNSQDVETRHLVFEKMAELCDKGKDSWAVQLYSDILAVFAEDYALCHDENSSACADPSLEGTDVVDEPYQDMQKYLVKNEPELGKMVLFNTTDVLFHHGHWRTATDLLGKIPTSLNLEGLDRFSIQNRLVTLLKTKDDWKSARKYSDSNDEILHSLEQQDKEVPPNAWVRHWLNRFSVLYDQGEREEAIRLCEEANRLAREHGMVEEMSATLNNLGIAYIYLDRPKLAESVLREGIAVAEDYPRVYGHLHVNLGLVLLTKLWDNYSDEILNEAEDIFEKSVEVFQQIKYRQGLLYGDASLGLLNTYYNRKAKDFKRRYENARVMLEQELKIAQQLKEMWPTYGIQADLALWHLRHPDSNKNEALVYVEQAYLLATENEDPEGISLIAMIAAKVLLDMHQNPDDIDWRHLIAFCSPQEDALQELEKSAYEFLLKLDALSYSSLAATDEEKVTPDSLPGLLSRIDPSLASKDMPCFASICLQIALHEDESKRFEEHIPMLRHWARQEVLGVARRLLRDSCEELATLRFHSAAALAAQGLCEIAALGAADPEECQKLKADNVAALSPELPTSYADTFRPLDWKFLFLIEM